MSLLASAIGIILGSVYFILGDNRVVLVALITLVISAIALTSLRHRYKEIMSCLLMFLVVFLNYNIRSEYLEFKAFTKQSVQETLRTKKIEILTSLPIKVITKTRDKFYQSDYIVEQEDSNPLINYFLPKRFLITAPSVLGLESGDYIKLDEKITLNKLDYFERKIYRKDKVYYKSSKTKVEYIGKESNWIKDLQDKVSAYYYKTLSEENYQITLNLLFGSRAFKLEPEFSKQIRRLGLGHFFAASGFHLVVLSFAINWILGLLRLGRRSKSSITFLLAILYTALAGFSPSIVRAAVFVSAFLALQFLNRKLLSIKFLLILAGITLFVDPFTIFDIGFQLSYLATLALFIWARPIEEKLKFLPKQISEVASVTLAVQLLLLPLTIYYFDNLQIWSILANILFAPILTLVTLASFLGLSFILNPTLDFFKYLVSLTHDLPYINASMQISLSHMVLLTILINFLAIIIFQPFKNLQMKEFRPDQYFEDNFLVLLQKLCSNRYTQVSILASSLLMLLATTLDPIGVKSYHIDNGLVANKQLQEILKSKKHFGYFDIDGHKALIIKSPRTLKKMDLLLNNLQEVEFLFLPNLSSKDIYFDTLIKLLKPQFVVISSYKENEKIKTNTETIASQSQTIINSGVLFISKNKFWSLKGD